MSQNLYPEPIEKVINFFKKLSGVGRKTAERYAFELLEWQKEETTQFAENLSNLTQKIKRCSNCNCIIDNTCNFCLDQTRDSNVLCILSSVKDVYLFEETKTYKGHYHILDHLINPIEGKGPDDIGLDKLLKRFENKSIKEVIVALDATLEADATALYIKKALEVNDVKISRLAFGIPMGSSLEQIDEGTLTKALMGRGSF